MDNKQTADEGALLTPSPTAKGAAPFVSVSVAWRGSLRYKKISAWSKKSGSRLQNFSRKILIFFESQKFFPLR